MIQLHRLEGFYWVATTGGYARAARAFPYPITQPGVHQQVSKLEEELDEELFARVAKDRVRLTPAGRRLYDFCRPFFDELPDVVRAIRDGTYGGELRIDAAGLVLRDLMPDWVLRLRKARPDIVIDLHEVQAPDADRLRSGDADLIVDYVPAVPAGFAAQQVATAHAFLVVPRDHPTGRDPRRLDALAGDTFVSYHPDLRQHALQMDAVGARLGRPTRTVSATGVDAIVALVRAGIGYSVVPWLDERGPRVKGVRAIRQTGPGTEFPVTALWRKSKVADPLVAAALAVAPCAS